MPWSLDTCSSHHSPVYQVRMHCASNRDTHFVPAANNSPAHLTTTTKVRYTGQITNGRRSGWTILRDPVLLSPTPAPTFLECPSQVGRLNHLRTGVRHFLSCLHKWSLAFVACECGAEEQTVDRVVLQCQIHQPHAMYGLRALDNVTTD